MTPEKQNMIMAELDGWKNSDHPDCKAVTKGWVSHERWCLDPYGKLSFHHERPDYLNNFIAVRNVTNKLLSWDWIDEEPSGEIFGRILIEMCGSPSGAIHARANQWVEALIKTMNKWE